MWNAFSNADVTELPMTWLIPHQHISPEAANRAFIVLRKDTTVKVLDVLVPIMAGCYFFMTVILILMNLGDLPASWS